MLLNYSSPPQNTTTTAMKQYCPYCGYEMLQWADGYTCSKCYQSSQVIPYAKSHDNVVKYPKI